MKESYKKRKINYQKGVLYLSTEVVSLKKIKGTDVVDKIDFIKTKDFLLSLDFNVIFI